MPLTATAKHLSTCAIRSEMNMSTKEPAVTKSALTICSLRGGRERRAIYSRS
jgi:hypothetical protein